MRGGECKPDGWQDSHLARSTAWLDLNIQCNATCRFPCYVFCICLLTYKYQKYKSVELGDQLGELVSSRWNRTLRRIFRRCHHRVSPPCLLTRLNWWAQLVLTFPWWPGGGFMRRRARAKMLQIAKLRFSPLKPGKQIQYVVCLMFDPLLAAYKWLAQCNTKGMGLTTVKKFNTNEHTNIEVYPTPCP